MCGFAGVLSFDPKRPPSAELVRMMGRQIQHRGPDETRAFTSGSLTAVVHRLAIIDVEGGSQPLLNETDTIALFANGEVFNHGDIRGKLPRHSFRSRSDVEAILHGYEELGLDVFSMIRGMFAVVLWDSVTRSVVLARDRFGIKPLYYWKDDNYFAFGSELKAVLAHPLCPSEFAWGDLEAPPDLDRLPTFVQGVSAVSPGSVITCTGDGRLATRRFWDLGRDLALELEETDEAATPSFWTDRYASTLGDSIHEHLVGESPIAVLLSGGVDSAALACVAAQHVPGVLCFTVSEETTRASGDVDAAIAIAKTTGATHHLVDCDELARRLEFSLETLDYFVWLLDRPEFQIDYLFKYELYRYAKHTCPHLKVVLIGQGADEFAGGYSNQLHQPFCDWEDYITREVAERQLSLADSRVGVPEAFSQFRHRRSVSYTAAHEHEIYYRTWTLAAQTLWYEDRLAASQGMEARVPFLDSRLVDLLLRVPSSIHSALFWDKRIIRDAAARWVPRPLVERPKVAFYHVGDERSIDQLRAAIVDAILPTFVDKYLSDDDAIFSPDVVRRAGEQLRHNPSANKHLAATLLQVMAIAVFERMCKRLPSGWSPAKLEPPSALREAAPSSPSGGRRHQRWWRR